MQCIVGTHPFDYGVAEGKEYQRAHEAQNTLGVDVKAVEEFHSGRIYRNST